MIRFLLGRPGSGKTYRIVEEVRRRVRDGESAYLLVPEQQVYSTERDVLSVLPLDEAKRVTICSFTRLCDLLSDRYGGRTHTSLSRATRALLMWHNLRELSGLLETYGTSAATDTSLCSLMLQTIDELTCNGVSPYDLEAAADKIPTNGATARKLRDLALIGASFDRLVCEICGQNPADRLLKAAHQVEEHKVFRGAHIYIDSFTSFTAQEYALLRPLLAQADDITVALCADRRDGHEIQFDTVYDTLRRLTKLADDVGLGNDQQQDILLHTIHRTGAVELTELGQSLWRFELTPETRTVIPKEERGHIELVSAANIYEEAEAAALHILELVESGFSYGEIAVVVRDIDVWRGVLDAALEQYHIPYFLSERTDLNTFPAARLMLCALRCVSRQWQTQDVIYLCKTGMCGIDPRDLDYFVEYIDTWHIRGKRMTEGSWSMNPDGYKTEISGRGRIILEAANRVREVIMPPLMALDIKLKASTSVSDQCRAIFEYLCDMKVKEQLSRRAEDYLTLGQAREAGEQVRLWGYLTEALASIATVLPDECEILTADELVGALSILFSESDIGSVPGRHDCVTVGAADLLRVDNIRASLLLGLNEGEFPRAVTDTGLLTEQDKAVLNLPDNTLNSRIDRRSSEELLYVWRAMTKPSNRLILSYSLATTDGSVKAPSAAIARVKFLFDYLQVTEFRSSAIRDNEGKRYALPTKDEVSRPRIHALLGQEIWQSQSRLQTYARCPYSYYGAHILKLRGRAEAIISNDTAGNFIHHVMEHYLRAALDEHHHLRLLTAEASEALVEEIMKAYVEKLCGDITREGRLLHLFDRLHAIALVLVKSIRAELEQSTFLPIGLEWDISSTSPNAPTPMLIPVVPMDAPHEPLPIPSDETTNVLMRGRIDRVDAYRSSDGKRVYVRVIDYKSSKHDFKEQDMVKDLNIQLMLYLFTLCAPVNRRLFADEQGNLPEEVLPAQALYISPDESSEDGSILPYRSGIIRREDEVLTAISAGMNNEYLLNAIDKKGKPNKARLCTPEHMAELENTLKEVISETVSNLCSGQAHRTPSTKACAYCAMREGCAIAADKPKY